MRYSCGHDRHECEDVIVLRANTGFSPNGDGINDYFTFEGLENYPKNTLEVYNRWGNRILKRENYQGNWDGTWGAWLFRMEPTFYPGPEGHPRCPVRPYPSISS